MVQNAEITRDTVTGNFEYAIADNLNLFSRLSVVRNQSTGRFAPPAARYPGLLASDPANPYDVAVTGYWRWTEIGNRGSDFTDDAWDFVTQLTYTMNDNVELAISVGLLEGEVFADLDYDLDSNADVDMNIVMTSDGRFVEVQGTGEESTYSSEELSALINS